MFIAQRSFIVYTPSCLFEKHECNHLTLRIHVAIAEESRHILQHLPTYMLVTGQMYARPQTQT